MSEITIAVENLSKRYRIGLKEKGKNATLVGGLLETVKRPLRNLRDLSRLARFEEDQEDADDVVWAVRDVSFDVHQGEVVGLIGRNGAGKSTLLKLLARITAPSSGRATIYGTVSSLLEVGTGFHPELTGRHNVFLNGAILGMGRREISRKFDEIVEFSGVERFIDTPVKRYSTGMKVRLAFSVAAHLEPDILLVDEVLSVGDAAFQKKCLGKMDDVARRGRTVIFVSHNEGAVTRLCDRILLLERGGLVADGPAHDVMSTYLRAGTGSLAQSVWDDPSEAPGGEVTRLRAVRVLDEKGRILESVDITRPFRLEMEYEVLRGGSKLLSSFRLWNAEQGVIAFPALDLDPEWRGRKRPTGLYRTSVWIPGDLLAEGMFTVDAFGLTMDPLVVQFTAEAAVAFNVVDRNDGTSARGDYGGSLGGVVRPKLQWQTEYEPMGRVDPVLTHGEPAV